MGLYGNLAEKRIFLPISQSCGALFCSRLAILASSLEWLVGVHTNAFSFENVYIFDAPAQALRPHSYGDTLSVFLENAYYISYQCGPSVQNGRKRIKIKTMTEICQISQARMFVECAQSSIYVTTCDSTVFERFTVDSLKRIKTLVWTRIDRCFFNDNENAYF